MTIDNVSEYNTILENILKKEFETEEIMDFDERKEER